MNKAQMLQHVFTSSGSHCPSLCLNPPHICTHGKWGKPRAAVLKMAAENAVHYRNREE